MNYIDPEDFVWSDELTQANFTQEKCMISNSLIINDQNSPFEIAHSLKKETIGSKNSIQPTEEKCYTTLGESKIKLSNENSFEELKTFSSCYSGDALNCLYRSEEQSIDLENVKKETKINHISPKEYVSNDKPNALILNNKQGCEDVCDNGNTLLNAETISLISNSISGVYEPLEPFSPVNYESNEHDQVVPINNTGFEENENPLTSFNSSNQGERILIDKNSSKNYEKNNSSNITKEGVGIISSSNEAVPDEELLVISAYTPGGQCYKLCKRSNFSFTNKEAINEKQLKVAALLNTYKKIRQIQCGIYIPKTLDYKKEADFNNWLREEKDKAKSLFENFDIKLNIKNLRAERELIKVDRYLKQYTTMFTSNNLMKILESIEKSDIDLTNLVFAHQLYETVSKITHNCKGRLRVKSKAVLMKLKSLLSTPKGVKDEMHLNDLLIKNNVNDLKPEALIEWLYHLLIFL